ncbi:hypothetical protein Vadar_021074 [Vaccinium darrowii]|uniref:Uncharacterized protein n=1 Tax=Vaccinium darrowii TaxID=229202 RepID=A0ACB7Y292_9ERIC|nr:hypothetical protein Vadar_021074 [Vaccinium darrowii]
MLEGRKYLIVMDDIWGVEAWNDIHRSFPNEFKGSKVLFTSRLLVQLDSVCNVTHHLAPLSQNSCWDLLQIKHRRLFTGHQFFEKFSLGPQNLRSFLCLSLVERDESRVEKNLSFFVKNFELLRVLSLQHGKWDKKVHGGHLVHLRYSSIAYKFYGVCALPSSNFLNLETLNLESTETLINLPCDIFKMVKLRHLYTKDGVFTFHLSSQEAGRNGFDCSSKLDSLQTLHQICACEACRSFLVRAPNLRKLGLHGGKITNDKVLRLPDLEFLECLETLTFTRPWDSLRKSTLPPGLKLPPTITRITLKNTRSKWDELSLLQTLPNLEVLKLIDDACCGPVWNTSELEGFPQLKYLRFYYMDFKEWIASEDQFPKLEVLALEHCRKLERIPIAFDNLNELREIKLEWGRRSAEESAKEIQEEQRNRKGDDDCLNLLAKDNSWLW